MDSGTGTTFVNSQTQVPLSTAFQVAAAASSIHTSANSVSQFQDAIMSRIGRSFGFPPGCDLKDLGNLQFSGAGVNSVRPDGLVGFPILPHMVTQPSLFHHLVDSRISSAAAAAASAFRPFMNCSANVEGGGGKGYPSAFQAPRSQPEQQKRLSSPTLFSPGQNLYPNNSTVSVTSSTPSPTCKRYDENSNSASKLVLDRHDSISPISAEGSSIMDDNIADHSAKRARYSLVEGECCPICGLHLAHAEIEAHYKKELEILSKVSDGLMQKTQFNAVDGSDESHSGFRSQTHHQHHHSNHHNHQSQHHHHHQQQQQQQQHPQNVMDPLNKHHMSPKNPLEIAPRSRWDTFQRIQRNRQSRIRVKLSRRAGKRPDEILEEEGQEQSNQLDEQLVRQKAQTHLRKLPALSNAEVGVTSNDNANDDDIDIVSCDKNNSSLSSTEGPQDWQIYGPVQYTEADVLACVSDAEKESNDGANTRDDNDSTSNNSNSIETIESIEVLRLKLEELERLNKCSKCQEPIQKPVVNISCWHIKCETCWLRTLGTSKCCTVCGVTSVPADLRKVYVN
ncbi:E3 ubiquitin-protein ligase RNF220-like [Tigriopus californicus]|uniref:E3 ubiquitin-protein ligase RNF220-like n=1 Tax=Tigriopus californicus TaxID=6832 RepID=UPI0027DA20CB|nr:E3 ubiquitin-protein ligase RNF220-like [Tigriopus californicus]